MIDVDCLAGDRVHAGEHGPSEHPLAVSGSLDMSSPTSTTTWRIASRSASYETGITAAAIVQPWDWLATRRISPLRKYQTTPDGSRIRVTRSADLLDGPVTSPDVDQVTHAVLVLHDHEEAGQVVLDQRLRAEAQRHADDPGAGQTARC